MKRSELLAALNIVKPGLTNYDFIPILSNFCFDRETIMAYDDLTAICTKFAAGISGGISGQTLLNILGKSSAKEFEVTGYDNGKISCKLGRTKLTLPVLPTEDFLFEKPDEKRAVSFTLNKDFYTGIKMCMPSINTDPNHREQMGISVDINKKRTYICSTDNITVSRYKLKKGIDSKKDLQFILPKPFCEQLIRFSTMNDVPLKLSVHKTFAIVDFEDGGFLFTKLYTSSVTLDYADIFEAHRKAIKACTDNTPKTLKACTERSLVLLSKELDKTSTCVVASDSVMMKTDTALGKAVDKFKLNNSVKDDITYSINPELILRYIGLCNKISFSDSVVVMTSERFVHLVSRI